MNDALSSLLGSSRTTKYAVPTVTCILTDLLAIAIGVLGSGVLGCESDGEELVTSSHSSILDIPILRIAAVFVAPFDARIAAEKRSAASST